mmetsp:Transcript_82407/g.236781  ORF Transcript_82407/g.236781 Transcript_82407/m.236781 type:complete len:240 (-) Transcript_82407:1166-1885(-)
MLIHCRNPSNAADPSFLDHDASAVPTQGRAATTGAGTYNADAKSRCRGNSGTDCIGDVRHADCTPALPVVGENVVTCPTGVLGDTAPAQPTEYDCATLVGAAQAAKTAVPPKLPELRSRRRSRPCACSTSCSCRLRKPRIRSRPLFTSRIISSLPDRALPISASASCTSISSSRHRRREASKAGSALRSLRCNSPQEASMSCRSLRNCSASAKACCKAAVCMLVLQSLFDSSSRSFCSA